MHSTQYLRIARAADTFGYSVVAMYGLPADEGTHAAAVCILVTDRPTFKDAPYAVGMCVLPGADETYREAHFTGVRYDLTHERARQVFTIRLAGYEGERMGEVEGEPGVYVTTTR